MDLLTTASVCYRAKACRHGARHAAAAVATRQRAGLANVWRCGLQRSICRRLWRRRLWRRPHLAHRPVANCCVCRSSAGTYFDDEFQLHLCNPLSVTQVVQCCVVLYIHHHSPALAGTAAGAAACCDTGSSRLTAAAPANLWIFRSCQLWPAAAHDASGTAHAPALPRPGRLHNSRLRSHHCGRICCIRRWSGNCARSWRRPRPQTGQQRCRVRAGMCAFRPCRVGVTREGHACGPASWHQRWQPKRWQAQRSEGWLRRPPHRHHCGRNPPGE
jgi:hypothetical protein